MGPAVKYGQIIEYIPGKYTRFRLSGFALLLAMAIYAAHCRP